MTAANRKEISHRLGADPVYLNAADWGWVQRPRLYWGLDVAKLKNRPGVEIARPGTVATDLTVVRYTGSPVPRSWSPGCGGKWTHRCETGVRALVPPGSGYSCSYPDGRFMTFTTCFPHPADRPPRNATHDPHIFARFKADGRMHPLYTYARGNCVHDLESGQFQQLSADDREVLMGFQKGYTNDLARRGASGSDPSGEFRRRSAVGNSFHLPSIALLYALLIAPSGAGALPVLGAPAPPSRPAQVEHARMYSANTVFSPAWLAPDHLRRTGEQLFDEAISMFPQHVLSQSHTFSWSVGAMLLACPWTVCKTSLPMLRVRVHR